MATWLRQSTSVDVPVGPFLDDTDGKTAETALTITQPDVRLKKNNGNWAQKAAAQTLTHEENGWYEVTLDATDTNTLGILVMAIHEAGALPVWREFMVVPAQVWDSYLSTDLLQVDTREVGGTTQTAGDIMADTNDIQTRLPAALVGGRMDSSVGAMAANVMTAAAAAADLTTELQTGLATSAALTTAQADLDDIQTRLPAALVGGRIDANVGAISTDATAADNLEAALDGTGGVTITAALTGNVTGNLSGSVGSVTGAVGSVTGAVGSVTGNVGGNVAGSVGSLTTNNDKTGYALSAGGVTAVQSGLATAAALATTDARLDTEIPAILAAVDTEVAAIKVTTDKIETALEADGPVYRYTTNALEQAPAGGGGGSLTAADVWTYGTRTLTSSSGGTVGSGSTSHPVTVTQPNGVTPIEGVAVWVSSNLAGTTVVAGTEYTDALGRINGTTGFMLDPGPYYLWRQHSDWTFANPLAFTV